MVKTCLLALLFALLPIGAPVVVQAKPITMADLTVDLPDAFKASESDRGLLAESPDGQAYLWVEAFNSDEFDALVAEHDKYWETQGVSLGGEPVKTSHDNGGGVTATYLDFAKATWKGEPTVVRYIQYGPYGAEKKMILLTFWGTPKSDTEFAADINTMIGKGVQFHTKE